jgi:hypothetical protein
MFVLGTSAQQTIRAEKEKYSASKKNELKKAIDAYPKLQQELQEAIKKFNPIDSLLKAEYISTVDSVVYIDQVERKQPYTYQDDDGMIVVRKMYDERRTLKAGQATQQEFTKWLNDIKKELEK